ncbi:HAMP domain-containing sensor histidine kinase [Candidatus Poriferisodalis sp.]|uniref:HAMP domain-containing sensor histidine kinase n=1 Tax=Candidatus Poriferisodalis sp. TaxID=3101277 RepID=UPI003B016075
MSFRTRLGLLVAASVAVAVLAVSGVVLWIARNEARSAIDEQLAERAHVLVRPEHGFTERVRVRAFGKYVPYDVLVQVIGPRGTVRYISDDVLPVSAEDVAVASGKAEQHSADVRTDRVRLRVLTVSLGPRGALMVARPLREFDHYAHGVRQALAIVALAGVAAAGLLGFFVAGRAIRPVRRLTDAARTVAKTQDFDHPIELDRDDELGELARSFNSMLEALAMSRAQQHRLVTDAGHELRTPVTSIRTNIELLARAEAAEDSEGAAAVLDADERRRMLDDVQFELDQLTELVAELVELATDRRAQGEPVQADLAEIAASVVERHRRRTGVDFETDFESCDVVANIVLVERAISNLVDNAVKWSRPHEPIEVSVAGGVVRVRDRGPGIDPAIREVVFERFYRAPEARSQPGSGLGLSIVDYVARTHDGTAVVVDTDGPGATVELRLPLVTDSE